MRRNKLHNQNIPNPKHVSKNNGMMQFRTTKKVRLLLLFDLIVANQSIDTGTG